MKEGGEGGVGGVTEVDGRGVGGARSSRSARVSCRKCRKAECSCRRPAGADNQLAVRAASSRIAGRSSKEALNLIELAAKGTSAAKHRIVDLLARSNQSIDVFSTDADGDNALHSCIVEGSKSAHAVGIVEALLRHEPGLARAITQDPEGYAQSPLIHLMTGAAHRHPQLADAARACRIGLLLLDAGAEPLYKDGEGGWTFLHWAAGMSLEDELTDRLQVSATRLNPNPYPIPPTP